MTTPGGRVRFAEFEFDPSTGELTGPHGPTRLQPQPAQVLSALVARPGQLVTREELKQLVWPTTVVEADQGLNYCIRQIRAALADEADAGRFIETLPRRGYRFVAPIGVTAPPSTPTPSGRMRGRLTLYGALLIAAFGAVWYPSRSPSVSSPADPPVRIAILPLGASTEAAWARDIARDMTEQLVTTLTNAESPRFAVVGPATTARYVNDPRPHTEIGRELGVELVVSGGMRLKDSTMFVQAVRASDGVHTFAWRQPVASSSSAALGRALAQSFSAAVAAGRAR